MKTFVVSRGGIDCMPTKLYFVNGSEKKLDQLLAWLNKIDAYTAWTKEAVFPDRPIGDVTLSVIGLLRQRIVPDQEDEALAKLGWTKSVLRNGAAA